jgi:hypothetical protein
VSNDAGLKELNRLLAERPTLRTLTDRIYVWYDYSCLPQPPRDGPDADLFLKTKATWAGPPNNNCG